MVSEIPFTNSLQLVSKPDVKIMLRLHFNGFDDQERNLRL